jgi:predicted membrane channel-forming protein YqfA (hemolysin III family)
MKRFIHNIPNIILIFLVSSITSFICYVSFAKGRYGIGVFMFIITIFILGFLFSIFNEENNENKKQN